MCILLIYYYYLFIIIINSETKPNTKLLLDLKHSFADVSDKPCPIVVIDTARCQKHGAVSCRADLNAVPVNYQHTHTHKGKGKFIPILDMSMRTIADPGF